MKTKEFMAKVRSLEFGIIQEGHQLVIRTPGCSVVARVNIFPQQTEIFYFTFGSADRRELLNIISEYTGTPPEEREEEEKRYWLQKIPVPLLDKEGEKKWLWEYRGMLPPYIFGVDTTKIDRELYKTIFTESEISQMDITGFEKVEVTE